jgi:zinc transport system substrate-binding protein
LDAEFRTGLRTCARKDIVTGHSAFGYLAGLIRRTGATTVFTETLASPKTAATLVQEAGVRTEVLDPIEGVKPGSHDDYFSIMRRDLATLRTALGCS